MRIRASLRHLSLVLLLVGWGAGTASSQEAVQVRLSTTEGDIRIELYPERAPETVRNFLRYVDGGHYDGASFYRTVTYENDNGSPRIQVIQGGLRDAEPPFEPIRHESTRETGLAHRDGTISMARDAVGTASSEFFICIGDQPGLDHGASRNTDMQGFAAFGRVVEGMEVVRRIHHAPADGPAYSEYVEGQVLGEPVVIESARRVRPGG